MGVDSNCIAQGVTNCATFSPIAGARIGGTLKLAKTVNESRAEKSSNEVYGIDLGGPVPNSLA